MTARLARRAGVFAGVALSGDPFMDPSALVSSGAALPAAAPAELVPDVASLARALPRPAERRRPATEAGVSMATPSIISGSVSEVFLTVMALSGPYIDMAV